MVSTLMDITSQKETFFFPGILIQSLSRYIVPGLTSKLPSADQNPADLSLLLPPMAGLFSFSVAGVGFLLIAALETLIPFKRSQALNLPFLRQISALLLSSLFLLHSLLSSLLSPSSGDPAGAPLPLSSAAAAAPFLLSSLLPSLSPLHPLLLSSSFFSELLLLHLRRKDLDGIENRYFDLLLVPVLVCLASTALTLAKPRSPIPRLARAAGLALHGTWLVQMGFSFFSSALAHGCFVHRRSWANYTIRCKGHEEYHRARAIATLQFNCHLALLVVAAVGVYAAAVASSGRGRGEYVEINKEMGRLGNGDLGRFSLEDEDEDEEEGDVHGPVSEGRNGFGGAH